MIGRMADPVSVAFVTERHRHQSAQRGNHGKAVPVTMGKQCR
jgi:hypothetical protein